MKNYFLLLLSALFILSCSVKQTEQTTEDLQEEAGFIPSSWIQSRVSGAEERLNTSEAGKLLLTSINAHGGLNTWFGNGPISFHFD